MTFDRTELSRKRHEAEQSLHATLRRTLAIVTTEEIEALVFKMGHHNFRTYVTYMVDLLPKDDEATLQVIQDCWNYFPHHSLDGKCPAEVMSESA